MRAKGRHLPDSPDNPESPEIPDSKAACHDVYPWKGLLYPQLLTFLWIRNKGTLLESGMICLFLRGFLSKMRGYPLSVDSPDFRFSFDFFFFLCFSSLFMFFTFCWRTGFMDFSILLSPCEYSFMNIHSCGEAGLLGKGSFSMVFTPFNSVKCDLFTVIHRFLCISTVDSG